jgi:hypothetical protein
MSTKLSVIINCIALQLEDPVTFKNCGWSSCVGSGSPRSEYMLWVAGPTSPMTLIGVFRANKLCFSNMIDGKHRSVDVKIYGKTPMSLGRKNSECGVDAVEDILDGVPNGSTSTVFKSLVNSLISQGYISGITLQAFPYDFRLSYDKAGLPF